MGPDRLITDYKRELLTRVLMLAVGGPQDSLPINVRGSNVEACGDHQLDGSALSLAPVRPGGLGRSSHAV